MVDQVIPKDGLAPEVLAVHLAAAAPRATSAKPRPVKGTDPLPQGQDGRPSAESSESTGRAAEQLNTYLKQAASELRFQVDEGTGRTFFKVINQDTGEVLLQVPSEEMLALARKLREMEQRMGASGVLMDKEG